MSVYHKEDVANFLTTFGQVSNSLVCILRRFLEMDCLQVLVLTAAILGLTYHGSSGTVKYDKLFLAMKQLYTDLISTAPEEFLDLSKPALKFISAQRYESVLCKKGIVKSLEEAIAVHKDEVTAVIKQMLPSLA